MSKIGQSIVEDLPLDPFFGGFNELMPDLI
jgi:hypothetical protein